MNMYSDPWSSKCAQEGCTGHLGKFDSCQTEALYGLTMDGGDETTGDTDFEGHLTFMVLGHDQTVELWDGVIVTVPAGAYIVEGLDSGAVYAMSYANEAAARIVFDEADERYSAWLADDGEV